MPRFLPLFACLLLLPSIAIAGDGPLTTLTGTGISPVETSETFTVVSTLVDAGADIQYCWSAIAGITTSPVDSYRYGWDVTDTNDPFDPGWAVPTTAFDGSEICAPTMAFFEGSHRFSLIVLDEAGLATTVEVQIEINQAVPTHHRSTGSLKSRY
jgi:hypothetical protein